jgi:dolichyl-phosphate beta-glucosyltransferase
MTADEINYADSLGLQQKAMNPLIILVVPCFNEEQRWIEEYWIHISKIPGLKLYFVNDGSTDSTSEVINKFIKNTSHILIELPYNKGKAEAIRIGFVEAFREKALGIGFLDADGAFPIEDVHGQIEVFRKKIVPPSSLVAVWSSRVQLSGRAIERKPLRHYFARIIVTLLALRFKFSVYDSQSGLKIFVPNETLQKCTNESFRTRWFIDLELFLRWRQESGSNMDIWEEPLLGWKDIGNSKLSGFQYLRIARDLWILNHYK